MHCVFSTADKMMFASANRNLGGPSEEMLRSRMTDGVFSSSAVLEWGAVDESFVRNAGDDELGILDCVTDEPAPSTRVLQSLRTVLFGRGDSDLDLQLRAGLHRLGRATADLDAASLQRITADLPASWAQCAKAAWFRLSCLEECRASAASLRELLTDGDEI
jgi:hypothetical protein